MQSDSHCTWKRRECGDSSIGAPAEAPYFCQEQVAEHFKLAAPLEGNKLIAR